jgi:tetratricopeptide (TPR) repeat protein
MGNVSDTKRVLCWLPLWGVVFAAGLVVGPAAAQDPGTDGKVAFDQGRAAHRTGKADEAVRFFERAVAQDGSNAVYHMWLGHAYSRQLMRAGVLRKPLIARRSAAAYNKAAELDPNSADIAEARFEFFLGAPGIVGGGIDKARSEAARLTTLDEYRGEMAAARIARHKQQPQEAEGIYRSLLTRFPNQSGAVEPLVLLLQNAGRYEEAFSLVDLRLAERPNELESLYSLGWLASVSGQHLARGDSAMMRFLEVVGADSVRQANAHYRLGVIREKLGDTNAAIAAYRAAVALYARHELAANALKNLERR